MEFEITKTTVECYKMRQQGSSEYWADITVDAAGKTGRIQIASDYGDWQYYWGSCGSAFKEFLLRLDIGYVANKFGEARYFDVEKTIALNKRIVIDWRKRNGITEEQARKMWEELESMNYCTTVDSFANSWYSQLALSEFFDEYPDTCTSISPSFKSFWKTLWPVFCDEIRKEIAAQPVLSL